MDQIKRAKQVIARAIKNQASRTRGPNGTTRLHFNNGNELYYYISVAPQGHFTGMPRFAIGTSVRASLDDKTIDFIRSSMGHIRIIHFYFPQNDRGPMYTCDCLGEVELSRLSWDEPGVRSRMTIHYTRAQMAVTLKPCFPNRQTAQPLALGISQPPMSLLERLQYEADSYEQSRRQKQL